MIIVKMSGQLGNQMFQYAIYRKLQLMGKRVKLDLSYYISYPNHNHFPIFCIPVEIATNKECLIERDEYSSYIARARRKFFGKRKNVISEIGISEYVYNPNVYNLKRGYIDGYWQSEKYLIGVEDVLRKEFQFPKPLKNTIMNDMVIEEILNVCSVSIHVRRGDYLGGFPVMDMEYYNPAIQYFDKRYENVKFFVFSNDILWCKENFKGDNFMFVDWNTATDSYYDMYLMSLCKHNIIANSSFSWWAAWLNKNQNKEVIAPKIWFNHVKTPDVYCKDWIQI